MTNAYTRNQHFWEFGDLSLGSQTGTPSSGQHCSGYGTVDPPVKYSQSEGTLKFFITKSLFYGELSWNNLLEYWIKGGVIGNN